MQRVGQVDRLVAVRLFLDAIGQAIGIAFLVVEHRPPVVLRRAGGLHRHRIGLGHIVGQQPGVSVVRRPVRVRHQRRAAQHLARIGRLERLLFLLGNVGLDLVLCRDGDVIDIQASGDARFFRRGLTVSFLFPGVGRGGGGRLRFAAGLVFAVLGFRFGHIRGVDRFLGLDSLFRCFLGGLDRLPGLFGSFDGLLRGFPGLLLGGLLRGFPGLLLDGLLRGL